VASGKTMIGIGSSLLAMTLLESWLAMAEDPPMGPNANTDFKGSGQG
jgi:hypothetical protein